ncbi:hypothetical protein [Campylobacter sputorum]|uniref:hypothetical protein n=1 Tax=Campylobacter sputorum TaxID=206 RepID=UPI0006900614|nr:hypothetical protein [Campylobacter sputorum]
MKNPNLTKEEYKILEKEYDEFGKLPPYEKYYKIGLFMQPIFLLIIFILPEKILTIFPFLNYFTNFMSQIFPNIEIYSSANKMPELTEFYFSYAWMIAIITVIWCIYTLPKVAKEARKYFGTGEFKNKGILKEKFIPLFDTKNSIKDYISKLLAILFFGYGLYLAFSGDLVDSFLGRWMFDRFGLLFVAIFQNIITYLLLFVGITNFLIIKINLKRLKNNIKGV